MTDFARKTKELNRSTTINSAYVPEADPFIKVAALSGERLCIPASQLPKSSPYENANLYRYQASGNISGMLGTGGGVQVYLTRGSGSGPLIYPGLILRMQVTNTDAVNTAFTLPVPLWLQNIQYFSPAGAPIAVQDGQGLWNNIIENMSSDDYYENQKGIGSDNSYMSGDPIRPLETRNLYVPLIGNPLTPGKALIAGLSGDFQILLNFLAPSYWQLAGSNLTLSNLTIDTFQAQLSETSLSSLITQYKMMKHDFFFPYERVQTVTQTWNTSSTYQIPLTGIAGDVSFIRFGLYPTLSGLNLAAPVGISQFQFQNNAGEPISGMNYIEGEFNRYVSI
jgi:hypothetical protein